MHHTLLPPATNLFFFFKIIFRYMQKMIFAKKVLMPFKSFLIHSSECDGAVWYGHIQVHAGFSAESVCPDGAWTHAGWQHHRYYTLTEVTDNSLRSLFVFANFTSLFGNVNFVKWLQLFVVLFVKLGHSISAPILIIPSAFLRLLLS